MSVSDFRTETFTFEQLQENLASDEIRLEQTPDGQVIASNRIFGDCPFWLKFPMTLRRTAPGLAPNPLDLTQDFNGKLTDALPPDFSHCALQFKLLKRLHGHLDSTKHVYRAATLEDADHIWLMIYWPSDQAPDIAPDLNSDFSELYKVIACQRNLPDDVICYGADHYLCELSAFDSDLLKDLADNLRIDELFCRFAWRMFEMRRPYYRKEVESCEKLIATQSFQFEYHDDYAIAAHSDGRRSEKLWYDERVAGFKVDVLKLNAQMHFLDGFIDMLLSDDS